MTVEQIRPALSATDGAAPPSALSGPPSPGEGASSSPFKPPLSSNSTSSSLADLAWPSPQQQAQRLLLSPRSASLNASPKAGPSNAPMSLAKLGGVGGVTRTGSWGRASGPGLGLETSEAGPSRAAPSSRSSTAYSGAAFSLRSVSNCSSASSAPSSTLGHGEGSDSTMPARDASSESGDDAEVKDKTTSIRNRRSSSSIGPGVNRVKSIGRGGGRSLASASEKSNLSTARLYEPDDESDGESVKVRTPELQVGLAEEEPSPTTPMAPPPLLLPRPAAAATSTLRDQAPLPRHSFSPPLSASSASFEVPLPRRHSGAYALRSRSALSQHAGFGLTFTSAGGGRAAARERAKNDANPSGRAMSLAAQGASSPSLPVWEAPSGPLRQSQLSPSTPASPVIGPTTWTLEGRSAQSLSRHMSVIAQASPDAPFAAWSAAPGAVGQQPVGFSSLASFSDIADLLGNERDASPAPAPDAASLDAPLRSRSRVSLTLPLPDAMSSSPASSATTDEAGAPLPANPTSPLGPRPFMSRSNTSTHVLRTPTTEEWSRFLARQGVEPSAAAAAVATRARSITTRSTGSNALFGATRRVRDEGDTSLSASVEMEKVRAGRAASLLGAAEDLGSVHESEDEGDEEDDDDDAGNESDARSESSQMSDWSDASSSERIRALHEAISRPPSPLRRPTPHQSGPPSPVTTVPEQPTAAESIDTAPALQVPSLSISQQPALPAPSRPRSTASSRARLTTREKPAEVLGYPLRPLGERRSIADFAILADIGRGAYGLVKKARLRGEDGQPQGPELVVKYIIKSRILADCWRRHKVLGPIPIEIHVMDQLRRLPFVPPSTPPPWAPERLNEAADVASPPPTSDLTTANLHIGHPALAKMVDFFEDHEFYYLVMPCFGLGQDLFDFVESAPDGVPCRMLRSIFGQVADGVRFLHANNIVHRDIKDENVILDGLGHAQIIDFGSAAHVRPGRLFDTFSGTLDYAAAEILRGEKYGGKEQDVWALGVVGYVLLCGDCPFWNGDEALEGLAPGSRAYAALRQRCAGEEAGDAASGQADGGGRLEDAADLIQQCLQLAREDRPTAAQVCSHRFLVGDEHGWSGYRGWPAEAA